MMGTFWMDWMETLGCSCFSDFLVFALGKMGDWSRIGKEGQHSFASLSSEIGRHTV